MSVDADHSKSESGQPLDTAGPLNPVEALIRKQRNTNVYCYTLIRCLNYLIAPVVYVDVTHTALCDKLGASKAIANLPTAMGAFFGVIPLLVAWLLPQTRLLRPVVAATNVVCVIVCLALAAALYCRLPARACIALAVLNGGVLLAASATFNTYLWEILVRGTTETDRGKMFSLALGAGPVFAVAGSEGVHWVMRSSLRAFAFPYNFALIFLLGGIFMGIQAIICLGFKVSMEGAVVSREPFRAYMLGGFKTFFSTRSLVILAAAYLLYGAGFFAMNNASLNVKAVLGVAPAQLSGRIDAIRFGTKAVAGFLLGFVLGRFGARAPALITSLLLVLAAIWALLVPGWAYLGAFGLFGAGELGGFYYPYYAAAVSRPGQVKRTTAIFSITGLLGFIFAGIHGYIADHFGISPSMWLSIVAAVVALLLVSLLPARPRAVA